MQTATVVRVVDGDTFVADVTFEDLILNATGTARRRVRLFGVDCPERSDPGGKEATEFTSLWLDRAQAHGPLMVEPVKAADAFGRLLAHVRSSEGWPEGGEDLGEALLKAGHARRFKAGAKTHPGD